MPTRGLAAFDTTLQHTHEWLDDLMRELGTDDRQGAWSVLTTVLHAIRDRLPPQEAAHLGAQLPMLIRGMFYDGWRPALAPMERRGPHAFTEDLDRGLPGPSREAKVECAKAVFRVLERRVAPGEVRDVVHVLPHEVQQLWARAT